MPGSATATVSSLLRRTTSAPSLAFCSERRVLQVGALLNAGADSVPFAYVRPLQDQPPHDGDKENITSFFRRVAGGLQAEDDRPMQSPPAETPALACGGLAASMSM
mmetsp:Transcript_280/g.920  ORF Transcript_280/g.920 Transcript_280/m.920 type:complete len:106 (+) Transcript_280:92-409(+)